MESFPRHFQQDAPTFGWLVNRGPLLHPLTKFGLHPRRELFLVGSILEKVAIQEQKELDQAVSISRFGFVNAVLRQFCE